MHVAVYSFNQKILDRQLLYSGPGGQPFDDGSKYNVVCTSGYTSRGIPSYLVSFCCPAQERHGCGPEIFTVQIRKGTPPRPGDVGYGTDVPYLADSASIVR